MATKKVKRELGFQATWASNILTVTTSGLHFALVGDTVTIRSTNSPQELICQVLTVPTTSSFTMMAGPEYCSFNSGNVIFDFFRTGQVAVFPFPIQHSTGAPSVVQAFVTGIGGATLTVEGSLNTTHWIPALATLTLTTADGNSQFTTVAPNWTYLRANISVIGAATKLEVLYSE